MAKTFLYLTTTAPHGSIATQEGLEMILAASAFGQDLRVVFMGEGVQALRRGQSPHSKDFAKGYGALADHGVEKLYADRESLEEWGLSPDDLLVPVQVLSRREVGELMERCDVVVGA